MGAIVLIFVPIVLVLIGALLWAVRPARISFKSFDSVLEVLSAPRHHYRLPQIMQALKASDSEFLIARNHQKLAVSLRKERREIALRFLDLLEMDYRTQIEAARALASWAPEVVASREWERLRLTMLFRWKCQLVRLRLYGGLRPWEGFAQLSEMAIQMSCQLESLTGRIAERALLSSAVDSLV